MDIDGLVTHVLHMRLGDSAEKIEGDVGGRKVLLTEETMSSIDDNV